MQRKKVLDEHDIQDILQICKMGIWRLYIDIFIRKKARCMFAAVARRMIQ